VVSERDVGAPISSCDSGVCEEHDDRHPIATKTVDHCALANWRQGSVVENEVVTAAAAVLAVGVLAYWLGWRLQVPPIVFLLGAGLAFGPVLGMLDPDDLFGDLLFPMVSLAVAVILFEGALGLGWRGVRRAGRAVLLLVTVGAAITLVGTMLAAHVALGVSWDLAVLLGAVLVVTGPTVVGPVVHTIGLRGRVGTVLEVEGTLIDPLGAIATVVVFEALVVANQPDESIPAAVLVTLGVGTSIGLIAGALLTVLLARFVIPDNLDNAMTLAAVIGAFAAANALRAEAGLISVTVMGFTIASQRRVAVRHILEFNETLRIIFISGLFILLGARIELDTLQSVEWRNAVFLVILVVVVRPLAVFVSTFRSQLATSERVFMALTAPRGVVAAAIASVFSLLLIEDGHPGSQVLISATFTVIAGTALLAGLLSRPLAVRLGLIEQQRKRIVVLGGSPAAREIAAAISEQGAPVDLIDLDERNLAAARMAGLSTHRRSVLADETWDALDLADAVGFVAMTHNDELNALAARRAVPSLGRRSVFQSVPRRREHRAWWTLPAGTFARPAFGAEATIDQLDDCLAEGWTRRATKITEQYGIAAYRADHPHAIPLFIVDSRGLVEIVAGDRPRDPRPGETFVTLGPPRPRPSEQLDDRQGTSDPRPVRGALNR
jgi:NhaP-type Na+/H+ or K+/H+ antiporter